MSPEWWEGEGFPSADPLVGKSFLLFDSPLAKIECVTPASPLAVQP